MCDSLAIGLLAANPDGFATYLGGGITTVTETNYAGDFIFYNKEHNATNSQWQTRSASYDEERHVCRYQPFVRSEYRRRLRTFSKQLELPFSASHALVRSMFPTTTTPIDGRTPTCATAEWTLSDGSLARIASTEGVLGHFISPDPTINYTQLGVKNDCIRSDKSLAQSLAYTIDKLNEYRLLFGGERVGVALAGDFMGQGLGVAPRLGYSRSQ